MRQPGAQLTDRELLNQCYVYCNNAEVGTVVQQVKNGLEAEGLTDLGDEVMGVGDNDRYAPPQSEVQQRTVHRREPFQEQDIFLPVVSHKNGDEWVQLDYQSQYLATHKLVRNRTPRSERIGARWGKTAIRNG